MLVNSLTWVLHPFGISTWTQGRVHVRKLSIPELHSKPLNLILKMQFLDHFFLSSKGKDKIDGFITATKD